MEFWDASFLDFVAVEREAAGMDMNPAELISRYDSSVNWGKRSYIAFFPSNAVKLDRNRRSFSFEEKVT